MLVNTNVKLQMTVEIALPALSSLCSVSDYIYLFNNDPVKICIKVQIVYLVAHFLLFAKCEVLDNNTRYRIFLEVFNLIYQSPHEKTKLIYIHNQPCIILFLVLTSQFGQQSKNFDKKPWIENAECYFSHFNSRQNGALRQVMCWQLIGNIKHVKSYFKFTQSYTVTAFLRAINHCKICSLYNKTFCPTILENSD